MALTDRRKQILVFWYLHHKNTNFWPTLSEASEEIGISVRSIYHHVKILVKEDWLAQSGHQTALTKQAEKYLYERELISLGLKEKDVDSLKKQMMINKIKKNK